jgi:hypothetical protein
MTPVLRRAASKERVKGTNFLTNPLDNWVGTQPPELQEGYAQARRCNDPHMFKRLREQVQQRLDERSAKRTVVGERKNEAEVATAAAAGTGAGTTATETVQKPVVLCELSDCVNKAEVFCSAPDCKVIKCGRPLVNGHRHDWCASHSKDAPVLRYLESSPSRDHDDSDDRDNSGGSDSKGHNGTDEENLDDPGNGTTPSGEQSGSDYSPPSKKFKSSSRCTPLPLANFLDDAAEAIQERVNGVATMHWMDPIEFHFRNDANVRSARCTNRRL